MNLTEEEILNEPAGKKMNGWIMTYIFKRTMSMVIEVPKYSTDISAVWEVVEKMTDNYIFNIGSSLGPFQWIAEFHQCGYKKWACYGGAPSLAICRAALLAMREEGEK